MAITCCNYGIDVLSEGVALPSFCLRVLLFSGVVELCDQRHGLACRACVRVQQAPRVPSTTAVLPHIAAASLVTKRVLDSGSFGDVCLAWWSGGHVDVAVKANGLRCANVAAINNERKLLELLLQHPHHNILVVYGICLDAPDGAVRLVMAHCSGGSLSKHLIGIRDAGQVRPVNAEGRGSARWWITGCAV